MPSHDNLQPIQLGIALFQDAETLEDTHWALVVHQYNVRADDVNIYHIRRRPSHGPREWLPAHTTIFGNRSAMDHVFPDTGARPLRHQYSCIGVAHIGMTKIPGPDVMRKFHQYISTFSINHDGNDPTGHFYTEREWKRKDEGDSWRRRYEAVDR
ncbi:hypothetical protein CVT24_010514 [Panaeolus cyanescens]|uniref:Uncharacterized protein n=1 Tax=Panaeolus cyanescens TaxID=181874 RepID=A0A409YW01_9AGAR|nr:hypothetical protein CVT24_010514 [Panaeolus cyanescens]